MLAMERKDQRGTSLSASGGGGGGGQAVTGTEQHSRILNIKSVTSAPWNPEVYSTESEVSGCINL